MVARKAEQHDRPVLGMCVVGGWGVAAEQRHSALLVAAQTVIFAGETGLQISGCDMG